MSWLYSRALVEAYSEATSSGGAPFAPSSATPTPQAYLSPDRMTGFSRCSRYGMTYAHLTADLGADVLTWFLAAFPARTSAPPEKEPESPESEAGSGWKWRESSVKYDPDSRLWRTRQCSLFEGSEWFSETWPQWGSMRDGECWELPMSKRPIKENASGLWPTPTQSDHKGAATVAAAKDWNSRGTNLPEAVQKSRARQYPTPCNTDWKGVSRPGQRRGQLENAVKFPTPRAEDSQCAGGHRGADDTLYGAICRPKDGSSSTPGQLNPTWVEWLMGWPLGWTDLKPLATAKSPNAPLKRGAF